MNFKTGDKVVVIAGKDKGKEGKISHVLRAENRVVVEGVNIVKKHVKPKKMGEPGGILEAESALYASKVQLICPKCGRPTRTGSTVNAKGAKKRTCKKSDCKAEFD